MSSHHDHRAGWRNQPQPNWLVEYQTRGIDPSRGSYMERVFSRVRFPSSQAERAGERAADGDGVRLLGPGRNGRREQLEEVPWRRSVLPEPIPRRAPRVAGDRWRLAFGPCAPEGAGPASTGPSVR